MSERLALQQSIVCKMGCSSPKVLGPTRSAMSIVPPINPKYSIGPLPSDIFVTSPSVWDQSIKLSD